MLETLKRVILIRDDMNASRIIRGIWRRIADIPQIICFFFPAGFPKNNRQRIAQFKDQHKGSRCFIVANGPSLKQVDFNLLKDEYTIGMNRIYLMKDQNGFEPTYVVCVDVKSQLRQFTEDYNALEVPCFYEWNERRWFDRKPNLHFIKSKLDPRFSLNPAKDPFGNGQSVTYTCIQLAFFMGFDEVYLIGKDHSYNVVNKGGTANVSTGNESNHFIKGYYNKGQTFGTPDYASEEYSYRLSRKAYERHGKKIMNATHGGKLEVFERVDFETLFKDEIS